MEDQSGDREVTLHRVLSARFKPDENAADDGGRRPLWLCNVELQEPLIGIEMTQCMAIEISRFADEIAVNGIRQHCDITPLWGHPAYDLAPYYR